jgi:hypothetical protein
MDSLFVPVVSAVISSLQSPGPGCNHFPLCVGLFAFFVDTGKTMSYDLSINLR